jgi:hypothetical protein
MIEFTQKDKQKLLEDIEHEIRINPNSEGLEEILRKAKLGYAITRTESIKWQRTLLNIKDRRGDEQARLAVSKARVRDLYGYLGQSAGVKSSLADIRSMLVVKERSLKDRLRYSSYYKFPEETDILLEGYTIIENALQHINSFDYASRLARQSIANGVFPLEQVKGKTYRLGETRKLLLEKQKKLDEASQELYAKEKQYKEHPSEDVWTKLAELYLKVWALTHAH